MHRALGLIPNTEKKKIIGLWVQSQHCKYKTNKQQQKQVQVFKEH
jgi:hypothetical protein